MRSSRSLHKQAKSECLGCEVFKKHRQENVRSRACQIYAIDRTCSTTLDQSQATASYRPEARRHLFTFFFFFSRIKIPSISMNETNASFPNSSGRRSLHIQKHTCASCGYPAAKTRGCTFFCLLSISVLLYIPLSLNALIPIPPNMDSSVG